MALFQGTRLILIFRFIYRFTKNDLWLNLWNLHLQPLSFTKEFYSNNLQLYKIKKHFLNIILLLLSYKLKCTTEIHEIKLKQSSLLILFLLHHLIPIFVIIRFWERQLFVCLYISKTKGENSKGYFQLKVREKKLHKIDYTWTLLRWLYTNEICLNSIRQMSHSNIPFSFGSLLTLKL